MGEFRKFRDTLYITEEDNIYTENDLEQLVSDDYEEIAIYKLVGYGQVKITITPKEGIKVKARPTSRLPTI
jgi:hypothetical protein